MNSSNDADLKPETTNEVKTDRFRSEDAENDLQMTPGDKLCEDELTVILSNSWISPRDLLNFRLVSRSWRDAATATLLRRDALVVELYEDSNRASACYSCFYKNKRGKKKHENKLGQLTELMSKSKKFPSTNFRIQTSPDTFTPYTCFPDLMHFFKLHGHSIKTLQPNGWITRKCALDILLIYTPTLEHLDLSKASITAISEEKGGEENGLEWTSKTLPFKSLTIRELCIDGRPPNYYEGRYFGCHNATGSTSDNLVRLLLSSPSKLNCIENVTWDTLGMVLTEGKGRLIRSFKYEYHGYITDYSSDVVMKTFLTLSPVLSKLAFDLGRGDLTSVRFITSVNRFNRFMQSVKDTVQNVSLMFSYDENELPWDKLLSIPPMKKLKSLTLVIEIRCTCPADGRPKCKGCSENFEIETNIDLRGTVFQFEDGISAENYFPSLTEVSLNSNRSSGYSDVSLMNFFSFKSDTNGTSANWNFLPKVDILSITRSYRKSGPILEETCQSPAEAPPLISQVFPNIRILKFRCGEAYRLSGALWALFPNVEFIEIYGIRRIFSICWGDVGLSHYVDEAFTGVSDQMLENGRRTAVELSCEGDDDLKKVKYALKKPSICDLRHLRQLKLKFAGTWSTEFASSATGINAFSKMPNTKFIISYDPETVLGLSEGGGRNDDSQNTIFEYINNGNGCRENGDDEIAKFEELIFGPLKPYVHIVHEKHNYDWWEL